MTTLRVGFRCVVIWLGLMAASLLYGQADRGVLTGTVVDPQGLLVQNAALTLKNTATGVVHEAKTSERGEFLFVGLPVGTYTLSAEATGFQKYLHQNIAIEVGRKDAITVKLATGQVLEQVSVEGTAAPLDTETSDVGTTVNRKQLLDLPVPLTSDSRNPLNFVVLTPGVSGSVPGATPDMRLHASGGPSYSTEVYIDGIPVADTNLQGSMSNNHPSIEAIGEFKMTNNGQSADFGLSGSTVSFTFRSGTNQLHGKVYEFLQNDALNALDSPTKALGGKKAPLKQNEYGFTLGGPVVIPKVYDGHDHTFFFVSYTGFKYRPSSNNFSLTTMPNAFRNGDFSQVLGGQITAADPTNPSQQLPVVDALGRPVYQGQIFDPATTRFVQGPDGQSYPVRDAFAGNKIDPSRFSAVSRNILPMFPQATSDAILNNYSRTQQQRIDQERIVVKIDHNFHSRHYLSGSYFQGSNTNSNNGSLTLDDAQQHNTPAYHTRFSYTYTIKPNLINNFAAGFLRDRDMQGPVQPSPSLESLGLTGITQRADAALPNIVIRGITGIGGGSSTGAVQNRFLLTDSVTWSRGAHTFKFGGEFRRLQRNEFPDFTGRYIFEALATSLNGTGFVQTSSGLKPVSLSQSTGSSAADFLLGAADDSRFSLGVSTKGWRWLTASGYVMDDWRVRHDLTLNLGLRYDFATPRTEVLGRVAALDPTLPNPAAGGLPGAYVFYGDGPGRNGKYRVGDLDPWTFQPRLGIAWSPTGDNLFARIMGNGKTVIRSSFAVTRPLGNDYLSNDITTWATSPGFDGVASVNAPGDAAGSPAFYWDSPFPNFTPPPNLDPGMLTGNQNPPMMTPDVGKLPTQFNWAFGFQHQLSGQFSLDVNYVGSHTYHLGIWAKPNQIQPEIMAQYAPIASAAGLPLSQFLNLPIDDPRAVAAGVAMPWNGFKQLFADGATVGQALRPFPQYGNIDQLFYPTGSVSYNGLQTKLQKRFSAGLTLLAAYTFSKTIGDVDSTSGVYSGAENELWVASYQQDYYNPRAERSVTSSDIPHVLALSYSYELPFGHGKRFLSKPGVLDAIVGGWQVSGIHLYQSGRPFHIEWWKFGADNPDRSGDYFGFRPNVVPGVPLINPDWRRDCSGPIQSSVRQSCQFYLNPAAFESPGVGFGDAPRFFSNVRYQPYFNEDLTVSKKFSIKEKATVTLRADFFNAFNRVVLGMGGGYNSTNYTYAIPNLDPATLANTSTVFGIYDTQQNAPRRIGFGLSVEF